MRLIALLPFALATLAGCDFTMPDDGRPKRVEEAEGGRVLYLGGVSHVPNTPFFTLPLQEGERSGGSYSGSAPVERNRLIVDGRDGGSRRLLPDNDREIVRWLGSSGSGESLIGVERSEPADERDQPGNARSGPTSYVAVVTSSAQSKNEPRRYDVLLGHFETGRQVWAARGLDGVEEIWRTADGRLAFVLQMNGRMRFRLYDALSFSTLVDTELRQ